MFARIRDWFADLFRTIDIPDRPSARRPDDAAIEARVAQVRTETHNILKAAELIHRAAATGQWSTDLMANRRGRGEWHGDSI